MDTLSNNFDKFSNLTPEKQFQLITPHTHLNKTLMNPFLNAGASHIDNMPIVTLNGYDKMPIVKIGGYYTMPVKHIGTGYPDAAAQNILPGLPTFKTP